MKQIKREIEKFPYGTVRGLLEDEAGENIKLFLQLMKIYGPTVLKIGIFVCIMPGCSFVEGANIASSPTLAPTSLSVTKEVLGVAAVGLICAAASINPVTTIGIAACALTIAAKAVNKL